MENAVLSPSPTKNRKETHPNNFDSAGEKVSLRRDAARSRFTPQPVRRLRLNARDLELLAFLADNHLASRRQIQRLFYGSKAYCNFRLRALFDHQVVLRHFPSITGSGNWGEEAIYSLGPSAIEPLIQHGEEDEESLRDYLRRHRSPALVSHSLHTVDIYLSFREALLSEQHLRLERWVGEVGTWHEYQRNTPSGWQSEVFKPDGFLRLQVTAQPRHFQSFFIECDLGHTSAPAWKTKVATHIKYVENGLFASTYGEESFQTLVVTTGDKRLDHLAQVASEAGGDFFRFSTWAKFRQNPLGAIWLSTNSGSSSPQPVVLGGGK